MPSRKRPADAAPDGAAAAAKKAGIVQLLEVIATHQMDPGLIEAVENDLTPALLEELRTEHPAAEWSYRSMWLRGLSRRAMNGHPFEDAVGHLAALSDDAGSHVAHLRKEMRVQAVLHHLRAIAERMPIERAYGLQPNELRLAHDETGVDRDGLLLPLREPRVPYLSSPPAARKSR